MSFIKQGSILLFLLNFLLQAGASAQSSATATGAPVRPLPVVTGPISGSVTPNLAPVSGTAVATERIIGYTLPGSNTVIPLSPSSPPPSIPQGSTIVSTPFRVDSPTSLGSSNLGATSGKMVGIASQGVSSASPSATASSTPLTPSPAGVQAGAQTSVNLF
jgi:hypothetical protein